MIKVTVLLSVKWMHLKIASCFATKQHTALLKSVQDGVI